VANPRLRRARFDRHPLATICAALDLTHGNAWWTRPPWYRHKERGSLRDIKGVLTEATEHFSQLDWQSPTFEKPGYKRPGGELEEVKGRREALEKATGAGGGGSSEQQTAESNQPSVDSSSGGRELTPDD
jgi:hypothetical protein